MAWCETPFPIYHRGSVAVLDPGTGEVKRQMVACGHCASCVKGRKNDWTGRLTAEGKKAKGVYFLTLTYKHEQEEFRYRDIQLMLYNIRTQMRTAHGATVRFFCVGERGNKTGRIHWHLLLFSDVNLGWAAWNKETQPGKLWPFWDHGWTQLDVVPQGDLLARIRYTAKYAVKRIGDDLSTRPRFSLKPLLGWEYIREYAENVAEKALPFRGTYTIPGHVFTLGPRKGLQIKYKLKGAAARRAAEAYVDAWLEAGHRRPWYPTPFLKTYFPDEMMHRFLHWPEERGEMDWCRDPLEPMTQEWVSDPELGGGVTLKAYRNGTTIRVGATKQQLNTIYRAARGEADWRQIQLDRGIADERFRQWLRERSGGGLGTV